MDLFFSDEFDRVISYARDEAMRTGHGVIIADHLLLGIIRRRDNDAVRCLEACGVDLECLKRRLDLLLFRPDVMPWSEYDNVVLSPEAHSVIGLALAETRLTGCGSATAIHLLSAVCKSSSGEGRNILADYGFSSDSVTGYERRNGLFCTDAPQMAPAAEDIAAALERELREAIDSGKLKPLVFS